ncbi:hypothetical protein [Leptospira barantonii]|uniref:Glycosyltransferase RgtA/B/C/D-like domain-containing protein n=1 Tax=Leptospira barantonii TaxID=2023184 RepID=A0ABX4NQN5_9LEPT|nr:hypothetical protein [Leptospira barantonii]PJZ58176.1 hypothetical protein CH367_07260 [Leptospira barantonii]
MIQSIQSFSDPTQFLILSVFLIFLLVEKKITWNPKVQLGTALTVSLIVSVYCFGPNLKAKFWLIDDHEVVYFLKSKTQGSNLFDFFNILLTQTEVGNFGESPRYRISYYFLRILESLVFKENSFLWYFTLFCISTFFVFSMLHFLFKHFSVAVSILFTFFVFSFRYWSDIFSRLGAGETYAVLGVALILLGLAYYRYKEENADWIFVIVSFGVAICCGSKENFLPLFLLPLSLLILEWKRKTFFRSIVLILPILLSIFTVISLYLFFKKNQVDIYGNSTRISDRVLALFGKLNGDFVIGLLILAGFVAVLSILESFKTKKFKITKAILLPIVLFGILLLNIVFYNGNWPTNSRYDFPGIITYQVGLLVLIVLALEILLRYFEIDLKHRAIVTNIALIFFLSSLVSAKGITDLQRDARANMKRTQAFSSFLTNLISDSTDKTIVLYVHQAFDFEPADSMTRYLNYYEDKNERMILVSPAKAESDFKNGLLDYLRKISKEGSEERKILPYNPKSLAGRSCLILYFPPASLEDVPNIPECKELRKETVPF